MHFPARHFTTYLEKYADEHVFAGKSLRERILCGVKVKKLRMEGGIWKASTFSGKSYCAKKVIDATGLTSIPNVPSITGSELFKGVQCHSKHFGRHLSSILQPHARVIIVGGGKSAGDVAYACAKFGVKEVHWVIRKSGNGPAPYLPADAPIKKYGNSNSAFHTSFMATFITNIHTPESWWTWFLSRTTVGQAFSRLIWKGLKNNVWGRARYDRPDGRKNGFANLKPDGDLYWQFASSGVNQRPDFFDTIAAKVKVYRSDIYRILPSGIVLQNRNEVEADAIVYATGWKTSTPFFDPQTAYGLGLATDLWAETENEAEQKKWASLEADAEREVLRRFPLLSTAPPHHSKSPTTTSFRLYRSLFPTTSATPTIAFLGKTNLANHTYNSEVQALYAIAVFDGTLKLPGRERMEKDVTLVNAWMKKRYPTTGQTGCFFFFDLVPYSDKLLEDLKMGWVRQKRGLFGSIAARDLKGILGEYLRKRQGGEVKKTV